VTLRRDHPAQPADVTLVPKPALDKPARIADKKPKKKPAPKLNVYQLPTTIVKKPTS
jgi:hypothetical protein